MSTVSQKAHMPDLRDTFQHAWRSWIVSLRRGGSSTPVILTLALAIAATTATFALVKSLLTVLPYPHAERLVMLWEAAKPAGPSHLRMSIPDYQDFVEQNRSFTRLGIFSPENHNILINGFVERVSAPQVGTGFFSTLGVQMLKGRDAGKDDFNVALVSERLWRNRFGWEDPIGQTVKVDGIDRRVIGIVPRSQEFPAGADVWLPFVPTVESCSCKRNGHSYQVIAQLRSDISFSRADSEIKGIAARLAAQYPDTNASVTTSVEPLRDVLIGDVKPAMWILTGATISLLLMACVSVASILVARGASRGPEIAMRQVLGASRGRIVGQLLMESCFSAIAASLLGSLLSWWVLRLFLRIIPDSLPQIQSISIDPVSVGFAVFVALSTAIIFSLLPALYATRSNLSSSVRGIELPTIAGTPRQVRSSLIVLENAFTFALLVTSVLLLNSLFRLSNIDPGFGVQGLAAADLNLGTEEYSKPEKVVAFYQHLLERAHTLPGVQAAAVIDSLPMTGSTEGMAYYPAGKFHKPGEEAIARVSYVSPEYFKTMSVPLLRGRDFNTGDGLQSHVVVVSEGIARDNWPNEDPIGKRIGIRGVDSIFWEVIGLVPDIKDDGLAAVSRPRIYFNEQEAAEKEMTIVVRTGGDTASLAGALRHEVNQLDSALPIYNNTTVEEVVNASIARNRMVARIVGTFSFMALVLAAVGVYGAVLANLLRRTKEFSIRIAVGSTFRHIAWLVLREGFVLVMVGIAAGIAAGLGSSHILGSLLFGIGKMDIPSYLIAACAQLAVVSTGCLVVLSKIAKLDPVEELRDR